MRAYVIGDRQGLASLTLEERAMPSPRPGQALVKVSAAGLNHRDHDLLHGRYRQGLPLDRIPLSDGVGEIVGMGSDRAGFAIGDRVTAAHFATWTDGPFQPGIFVSDIGISIDGWLGDYVLLPLQAWSRRRRISATPWSRPCRQPAPRCGTSCMPSPKSGRARPC